MANICGASVERPPEPADHMMRVEMQVSSYICLLPSSGEKSHSFGAFRPLYGCPASHELQHPEKGIFRCRMPRDTSDEAGIRRVRINLLCFPEF